MIITNTTNFRLKLKENLDIAEKEEVIITRNNNKNIVLLDLEKYKKIVAELEQLKASK
jgi:prevent-host-death family protein